MTIYLEPTDNVRKTAAIAFPDYKGKTFQLKIAESVNCASYWEGGSRSYFALLNLETHQIVHFPPQSAFDAPVEGIENVPLAAPCIIIEHSIFCGKDTGITFYVSTSAVSHFRLPQVLDLTEHEKIVLSYINERVSSYNGQSRFDMAVNDGHQITAAQWESAKTSLISKKLLNKAGAITVSGRNACETFKSLMMSIRFLDHIIVGSKDSYYSFAVSYDNHRASFRRSHYVHRSLETFKSLTR